jgi:type I restriction enzyme, R subunit
LLDYQVPSAEAVSANIKAAFVEHSNWQAGDKALRDLRQAVTFAICAELDDLYKVTTIVEMLFALIHKAYAIK